MSRESASESVYKQRIADLQQEKEALERDLAKLKREKYALADKLHQQEQVFQASHAGLIILSLPDAKLEVSFPWKKVVGNTIDESQLDYPGLMQLLSPAEQFGVKRMTLHLIRGHVKQAQRLLFMVNEKQEQIPLLVTASALPDENGEPLSVAFHLLVLQARELLEGKLPYLSIHQLPLPLAKIIRHSGEVLFLNQSAWRIMHEQLGEQEVQHISELVGSDVWQSLLQRLNDEDHDITLEFSIDSEKHFILHARVSGSFVDVAFSDISEIRHSIKELQQVNMQLDNFIYHASHDLKGPLRTVLGLLDILKIETNKDQRARCVDLIEGSIKRLDSLVVDLLSISRNRRASHPMVKVNFMAEVDHAVSGFYHLGNTKNLDIRVMVRQPTDFVADLTRIRIVFNNIVSNAIKYRRFLTTPSFIEVRIQVEDEAAYIEVEDNGEGIAKEQLPQIFDMFYRASETSEGSGLGLYIVKDVLQKLEGHIDIVSNKGEGTTVKIRIPNRK